VESIIAPTFVPVRVHVKEQPGAMERFGVQWTPTVLLLDPEGVERHRIEGFLPAPDFAAQLLLGLGHSAFATQDWKEAERRFAEVVEKFSETESAAEAQYWKGVSRYKATNDPSALTETADAFSKRYGNTSWAKKASVWAKAS
jgi:hypothetical protein